MYSGDGEWYSASVSGVTAADTFLITFAEYGNQEEVHRSNVRPRPDSSEVYRGVSAPKRKAVAEAPQLEEMPKVTPWASVSVVTVTVKVTMTFASPARSLCLSQELGMHNCMHVAWHAFQ